MKLFENITAYQAFKQKYEIMGDLEEERLKGAATIPEALEDFLKFMDEVLTLPVDPVVQQKIQVADLQSAIERQKFFSKIPPSYYDPS